MTKIVELGTLASLENQTSAIQTLNDNSQKIEDAFENTLSRDGSSPNQMGAPLDMNSKRILNLPAPASDTDPARWTDVKDAQLLLGGTVIPSQVGNDGKLLSTDGSALEWLSPTDIPNVGDLKAVNNLNEVDPVAARANLGLGTAATQDTGVTIPTLQGPNTYTGTQFFDDGADFDGPVNFTSTSDVVLNPGQTTITATSVGYRGSPSTTKTANSTILNIEAGRTIIYNEAATRVLTIPPGFPANQFVTVINLGSASLTIARGSGVTLAKAGSGGNANATVAQWGVVTLYQMNPNTWFIWGSNFS